MAQPPVPSPPRTWRRAARDAAPVAGALLLCPLAAALAPADPAEPVARARAVAALERDLGVFVEPAVHAWAQSHHGLLTVACLFYVWVHLPAAVGALVWAWLERPAGFPVARNVFVLAQAMTVAVYVVLPTAPPRMLADLGFEDTLASAWGAGATDVAHSVQSPYAALPSGHVVFALVAAGTVAVLARSPAVRVLAAAYPPLVVAVTVATANHFVVDVLLGVAVVGLSAAVVLGRATRASASPAGSSSPMARSSPSGV
jgi:PAP2 superfamily